MFESVDFCAGNYEATVFRLWFVGTFISFHPIIGQMCNDKGEYSFESVVFKQLFEHIIQHSAIYRVSDDTLIRYINDLEKDIPGSETNTLINSLSRPLRSDVQSKAMRLFACNILLRNDAKI